MIDRTQIIYRWNAIENGDRWVRSKSTFVGVVTKGSKLTTDQKKICLSEVFSLMHQMIEYSYKNQQTISHSSRLGIEILKNRVHERYANYIYNRGIIRRIWDAIIGVIFTRISVDHCYKELIELLNRVGDLEIDRLVRNSPPSTPRILPTDEIPSIPPLPNSQRGNSITQNSQESEYIESTVESANPLTVGEEVEANSSLSNSGDESNQQKLRNIALLTAMRENDLKPRTTIATTNLSESSIQEWEFFLTRQEVPKSKKIAIFLLNNTNRAGIKAWSEETWQDLYEKRDISYHVFVKAKQGKECELWNPEHSFEQFRNFQDDKVDYNDFLNVLTQHLCIPHPAKSENEYQEIFNTHLRLFVQRCVSAGKEIQLIIDMPEMREREFNELQSISEKSSNQFTIHAHRRAYY